MRSKAIPSFVSNHSLEFLKLLFWMRVNVGHQMATRRLSGHSSIEWMGLDAGSRGTGYTAGSPTQCTYSYYTSSLDPPYDQLPKEESIEVWCSDGSEQYATSWRQTAVEIQHYSVASWKGNRDGNCSWSTELQAAQSSCETLCPEERWCELQMSPDLWVVAKVSGQEAANNETGRQMTRRLEKEVTVGSVCEDVSILYE